MKVYENGIHTLQDSMDGTVVQVQEPESASVAHFTFDIRDVKHICDIQDVGIKMDTVKAVRHISRQVCKLSVSDEFFDLDIFCGQPFNFG